MSAKSFILIALSAFAAITAAAEPKISVGSAAPNFDLPVLGAKQHLALSNLRGHVVLLDFWASWCGPCRQSFPLYDQLRAELPPGDFTMLAINLDETPDAPRAFLDEHPVHYSSLADPSGKVAQDFGLVGMPSSFVLDRNGVVRARHAGFKPQDIDDLRKEILGLIAEPRGATLESVGVVVHPAPEDR